MDKITIFLRHEGDTYHADIERQGARAGWRPVALNTRRPELNDFIDVSTLGSGPKLVRFAAEQGELPSNLELWNTHQYTARNNRLHLLDHDTVPVECRKAKPGKWNGSVTTVDAPEVAVGLRYKGVTGLTLAEVQGERSRIANSVVVAGPRLDIKQVAKLAEVAEEAFASLVIWQGSGMRSSRPIVEVRTPGHELPHTDDLDWLDAFLAALRRGATPARAMLLTYQELNRPVRRVGPNARFLCDSIEERWSIEPLVPALPAHWKRNVDRFAQGAMVDQLLKSLSVPKITTRVQVVLIAGRPGSGLAHFVERFVDKREWIAWAEDPESQFLELAQRLGTPDSEGKPVQAVVDHVRDYCRPAHKNGRSAEAAPAVCCIAHRSIGFGEPLARTRSIDAEVLSKLLRQLGDVARRLDDSDDKAARLLVYLPLLIGDEGAFSALKQIAKDAPEAPYLRATVLPKLSERVPTEELTFWLESYNLDPARLHPHHEAPYEQLLDLIRNRYQLDD